MISRMDAGNVVEGLVESGPSSIINVVFELGLP